MKIYYAPNTRAVPIVWLFKELGLPYELETLQWGDVDRAPADAQAHSRLASRRERLVPTAALDTD